MKKLFITAMCLALSTSLLSGCFGKEDSKVDNTQATENSTDSKDENDDSKKEDVPTSNNNSSVSNKGEALGYSSLNIKNICDEAFSGNSKLDKITSITNSFYDKINNTFPLFTKEYEAYVPPTKFENTSDKTQYALSFYTNALFTIDNIPTDNSLKSMKNELRFFLDSNSYATYDTTEFLISPEKDIVLTDNAKNLLKSVLDDENYSTIEKTILELSTYAKTNKEFKNIEIVNDFDHKLFISVMPPYDGYNYTSIVIDHTIHKDL